jgi:hypothetical protein
VSSVVLMGRETGSLHLLAPLLLTGGKGADLVIRGNVVLNIQDHNTFSWCKKGKVSIPTYIKVHTKKNYNKALWNFCAARRRSSSSFAANVETFAGGSNERQANQKLEKLHRQEALTSCKRNVPRKNISWGRTPRLWFRAIYPLPVRRDRAPAPPPCIHQPVHRPSVMCRRQK